MEQTEREKHLREERILPLFLRFSLPAITGMLVQALYNVVDRVFIGNMPVEGASALSGIGVTMPIVFILMGFSMLFGVGAGANISIKMGQGRREMADRIMGTALFMLVLSAVAILVIFNLNIDYFLRIFGATDSNIGYARSYLRIILIGNLWGTIGFGMNNTIRAEGSPKYSMISMLVGAITNVILDPIFIFVFHMGVRGAAIATIIAQGLSTLWCVRYYFSGRSVVKIKKEYFRWDGEIVKLITAIGVSPFFIQIAGSLVGAMFNTTLLKYGGEMAQGSYSIVNAITTLFFMPVFGMNQGLQPIVGYNYGAGLYNRVRKAVLVAVGCATAVCIVGWIMMQFFPQVLVYPMAVDPVLREKTIQALRRYELLTFVVGFQIISSNFFQSIGKAKISFFLSLSRQVFILVPLIALLPLKYGLMGIWSAVPISDVAATILSGFFFIRELRSLKRRDDERILSESEILI